MAREFSVGRWVSEEAKVHQPDVRYGIRPVSRLYFPVRVRGHRGVGLPSLQLELRHRRVIGDVHGLWLLPVVEHVLGRIAVAPDYQGANLGKCSLIG